MNQIELPSLVMMQEKEEPQRNQTIQPLSCLEKSISHVLSFLCCPLTCCCSFTHVIPNQHVVNSYWNIPREVIKEPGIYYRSCIGLSQEKVSTAIRGIKIAKWKVNDRDGLPMTISTVIQWHVNDALKFVFQAEKQTAQLISYQALATLEEVASQHPFNSEVQQEVCLRKNSSELEKQLQEKLQKRVSQLGAKILTFSIIEMSYTEEMEKIFLIKQKVKAQANASELTAEKITNTVLKTIQIFEQTSELTFDLPEKKHLAEKLILILADSKNEKVNVSIDDHRHDQSNKIT